jgi:LacI family transcriptional regulator
MARGTRKQRITIKDVAELANVSPTAVSFVMNDVPNSNIPEETRDRIWDAVRQLDYRPNALARGLRARTTSTIGFISDKVASTPFAADMIAAAQNSAWAENRLLLLVNTEQDETLKETAVQSLLAWQVEGLIYATMYHRSANPPASVYDIPTVMLDCYVEDRSLPSVVPDEVQGGYTATEHLLKKGHRRIAFVTTSDDIPATHGRLQGYQNALAAYGVPFDPTLVVATEDSSGAGGFRATVEVMQRVPRPTAIFCFNDRMALGTYEGLRHLGLRIPNDVAVVGFDNQEMIAAHLLPALTTVQLPHYAMGVWAANYLLHHAGIASREAPIQHLMACPLVERAST